MAQFQHWFHRYNGWSYTKHRLWKDCKRRYYYRNIGYALQHSVDFDIIHLKRLKKLDNKMVLQGKLIHDVLEKQIESIQRGLEMDKIQAKKYYLQGIEEYRANAKRTIVEYYNGAPFDENFFDQIRENGLDQLELFFEMLWLDYSDLQYLRHERFDNFKIGNVDVIVKIDFVGKSENKTITIVDWKTGRDNEEYESELQIGSYVLWAEDYYGLNPDQITSELVYLATGRTKSYEFTTQQLEQFKELIISDYADMNISYAKERFEPFPEPYRCLSCEFSSICPHSRANEIR